MKNLFLYHGRDNYLSGGPLLTNVYTKERSDWGKIESLLENGEDVSIIGKETEEKEE